LLGITDSAEAIAKAVEWQGILTAMLLIGWSVGGFIFGYVADRFGRLRTLQITMAMFSIGTAACAAAPNIWFLIVCRIVVSLGIGGEWAAGANLVAESVPDHRRVEAAAIVYTGAPLSLFAASWLTTLVESLVSDSTVSWRVVMALGLLPGVFAFFVRCCVKEPEKWKQAAKDGDVAKRKPNVRLLFSATHRRSVLTGLGLCVPAIILWWSTNAFLATLSTG
jgi:MFS family permease